MENKRQGLGYITVQALHDNILCKKGETFKGHEFHWSSLHVPEGTLYAYEISKYGDNKPKLDGLIADHVLGSYTHVHFASDPRLIKHFLHSIVGAKICWHDQVMPTNASPLLCNNFVPSRFFGFVKRIVSFFQQKIWRRIVFL